MKSIWILFALLVSTVAADAQNYYRGYGGRTYYQPFWNQYVARYSGYYARNYGGGYADRRMPYAPRGGYDWSWGGGNRGYLGGRGGGWGGEW